MKKEALGYKVQMTPFIRQWIDTLTKRGEKSAYPISLQEAMNSKNEDWDMVSLESSEMEDANSGVFPFLASSSSGINARKVDAPIAIPVKMPQLLPTFEVPLKFSFTRPSINLSDSVAAKSTEPSIDIDSSTPREETVEDHDGSCSFVVDTTYKLKEPSMDILMTAATPTSIATRSTTNGKQLELSAATTKSDHTISNAKDIDDPLSEHYFSKPRSMSFDGSSTDDSLSEASQHRDEDSDVSVTKDAERILAANALCEMDTEHGAVDGKADSNLVPLVVDSEVQVEELLTKKSNNTGIAMMDRKRRSSTRLNATASKRRREGSSESQVEVEAHQHQSELMKPPRPSRSKSLTYQERTAIFGSWVSRKQSAANGSWKLA
jgi:hypothetical protein